jgi:hypothetical protein
MASHRAIAATCEAIVRVLRSSYTPAQFGGAGLDFQVYVADDFRSPMDAGVSLFLYRIYHNGTNRTPAGRVLPDGRQQRRQLPVDLHFLLTAWAPRASLQHEIAGWMMRVMEDTPTLPAALLNTYQSDVFHDDEGVEVALTTLSVDDMFHIWDVMIQHVYQLSVPYVARMLQIESGLATMRPAPIQERVGDYRGVEVVLVPATDGGGAP